MTDGGDRIRTAGFMVLPDTNADDPDAQDVPFEEVNSGQLVNIYYVEFIEDL
ncbi:hypothetical protein FRC10_001971, partial [Ceratobasidium sp. 414]